jgi:hypothetical protein
MTALPLKEMAIEEKLQMMESLWEDLCTRVEDFQSPDWHQGVLDERESALASGEEIPENWESAKRQIEKEIR